MRAFKTATLSRFNSYQSSVCVLVQYVKPALRRQALKKGGQIKKESTFTSAVQCPERREGVTEASAVLRTGHLSAGKDTVSSLL